ncbi:hypothetical protein V475_12020 [Sphingobium baderi LL03]|uniref:TonB-denpendent receptor n=1 Tax=Sphingobium baderi LL03 TaxID=1114964 RepID=T0FZ06_9SPHN|nr:hypothetical protein L485_24020 [Sphingobium baderi LL03]KMS64411.1 hypothetical protein V475_12020 [Sphingobium baderi LL03]
MYVPAALRARRIYPRYVNSFGEEIILNFKQFFLASCATIIAPAFTAFAQDTAPEAQQSAPPAEAQNTNEIVITARRREESLSRVPISVSAFSQDTLANKSISSIDQIAQATPGLTFGRSGGSANPQIVIRGQSRSNIGDAAQPVLTYFADVPLPYFSSILPTYDLGSVQVLKGPQGTLFGRNSTSGAVPVYPAEPTYQFEGYMMAGYGNLDRREAEGAVNIPIVADKLAVRIAGQRIKRDGYTHVVNTGQRRDDLNDSAFRVSVLLEPVDTVKNVFVYDYVKWNRAGDAAIINQVYPGNIPERFAPLNGFYDCNTSIACDIDLQFERQQAAGVRKTWSDVITTLKTRAIGISNTTTIDLGSITLKNIFGYRSASNVNVNDTDGTSLSLIIPDQAQRYKQYTDELQLQGSFLDDKLDTIVGAFYLKSQPNGRVGLTLSTFSPPSRPAMIIAYRTQTSKALFGAATYDFSDLLEGLKVDAGLRHTWDETEACGAGYSATYPFVPQTTPIATLSECVNGATYTINGAPVDIQGTQTNDKSKALTWNFGVNYQAMPNLFLYATVRRGYRAGGVNTPLFNASAPNSLAPYQTYAPEKVTDVELGAKASWRAGDVRGTVNFDVYRGVYKGSQRGINGLNGFDGDGDSTNDPSAGTIIVNAGNARVQGFDFEGTISPFHGLTFGAFLSYTDAVYTSSGIPAIFNGTGAFPADPDDTAFPYAPKWTMGGNVAYETEIGNLGSLALNADVYRASRTYFGTYKSDKGLSQPAYTLVNARIDLKDIGGSPVSLGVYARNLFDKVYASGGSNTARSAGFSSLFYAEPRTYGVQAKITF